MRNEWDDLTKNDPLARALLRDAVNAFSETKADRDLLARLRRDTTALAEDFLNEYLTKGLDSQVTEEVRKALDGIRIERRVTNVPAELKDIYHRLGLIRDYSGRTVELDYPQSLADALMLRVCPTTTIASAAKLKAADVDPLLKLITKAYTDMGLSPDRLAPSLAETYRDLSVPLLLNYMDINATKVYFMGPVFYGNAAANWTLTFATGSGLPDPFEWNGSDWFMERYSLSAEDLSACKLQTDKNPFRSINFSVGICNRRWSCRRLYVWQRSKTGTQMRNAHAAAKRSGQGELYLHDAVRQFLVVLQTPNLKIIEIEKFPQPLTAFTRVSPKDVMLSCRPETPEGKIAHAIWLGPGLRLSSNAVQRIKELAAGLAAAGAAVVPTVGAAMAALATCGVYWLLDRSITQDTTRDRQALLSLERDMNHTFSAIWADSQMPNIVKQSPTCTTDTALELACRTLSSLLEIAYGEVLEAYKDKLGEEPP